MERRRGEVESVNERVVGEGVWGEMYIAVVVVVVVVVGVGVEVGLGGHCFFGGRCWSGVCGD